MVISTAKSSVLSRVSTSVAVHVPQDVTTHLMNHLSLHPTLRTSFWNLHFLRKHPPDTAWHELLKKTAPRLTCQFDSNQHHHHSETSTPAHIQNGIRKVTLLHERQPLMRECGKSGKASTKTCYQEQFEIVVTKHVLFNQPIEDSNDQTTQKVDCKRTKGKNIGKPILHDFRYKIPHGRTNSSTHGYHQHAA